MTKYMGGQRISLLDYNVITTGSTVYTFCLNKNFIKKWCNIEGGIYGRYFWDNHFLKHYCYYWSDWSSDNTYTSRTISLLKK